MRPARSLILLAAVFAALLTPSIAEAVTGWSGTITVRGTTDDRGPFHSLTVDRATSFALDGVVQNEILEPSHTRLVQHAVWSENLNWTSVAVLGSSTCTTTATGAGSGTMAVAIDIYTAEDGSRSYEVRPLFWWDSSIPAPTIWVTETVHCTGSLPSSHSYDAYVCRPQVPYSGTLPIPAGATQVSGSYTVERDARVCTTNEYEQTVEWSLSFGPPPTDCRRASTSLGYTATFLDSGAWPLFVGLDVAWCYTGTEVRILGSSAEAEVLPSGPGNLATLAETLSDLFFIRLEHRGEPFTSVEEGAEGSVVVTAEGYFQACASLVPTGSLAKFISKLPKQALKNVASAAANKLVKKTYPFLTKGEEAAIEDLIGRFLDAALNLGGASSCFPVWQPEIGVRLHPDGRAEDVTPFVAGSFWRAEGGIG